MFAKDFNITGKHGDYMRKLTGEIDENKNKFFRYAYDAYKCVAIIGFIYGRKAKRDISSKDDYTIFLSQINNIRDDLEFSYRMIMLLDTDHESNFEERLQKAFNYFGTEKAKSDEILFEEYSLGGIEILYEKLIKDTNKSDDYISNLFAFVQEFYERYNVDVDSMNLIELCRNASVS